MMNTKNDRARVSGTKANGFGRRLKNLFASVRDWRVLLPTVLIVGYTAGLLSAFVIGGSHPVAVIHQGPYALTGVYQGNVYELIPMEEATRWRKEHRKQDKARIRTIGTRNPIIEDLFVPRENH